MVDKFWRKEVREMVKAKKAKGKGKAKPKGKVVK